MESPIVVCNTPNPLHILWIGTGIPLAISLIKRVVAYYKQPVCARCGRAKSCELVCMSYNKHTRLYSSIITITDSFLSATNSFGPR